MTQRVSKERRKELKEGSYPDLWEAEALVYEIEELEAHAGEGERVNRQWCECYRRKAVADECANCDQQFDAIRGNR